ALARILQLRRSVRQVCDERLEVEIDLPPRSTHSHAIGVQLRIDRLAILHGGEEAEGGPPAQLRLPVACRHRHLDVVGMDRVFLGKMPDLQAERIGADDVFDAPATAVAPDGPLRALQGAKVGAQAGNLAVVDRKGISASWIELACACRGRALPLPSRSL